MPGAATPVPEEMSCMIELAMTKAALAEVVSQIQGQKQRLFRHALQAIAA